MNTQAIREMLRTSYGTLETCIRQVQQDHHIWVELDSNNDKVISAIREQAVAFAKKQPSTNWRDIWLGFVESNIESHSDELSVILSDFAENFGALPKHVVFELSDQNGTQLEYKIPYKSYKEVLKDDRYKAVMKVQSAYYEI
jgi:hypothetical protein